MLPIMLVSPLPRRQAVLVVEDEILVRLTIAEEFRTAGFSVTEATNAEEALAVLEVFGTLIDVIVTDITMPGAVDGIGLAATARSKWPHLKIVMTSGHSPPVVTTGLADVFVEKPYDPAGVVRRVGELLAAGIPE